MEWLLQNWIWIVVLVAAFFAMRRIRHNGGRHPGIHRHHHGSGKRDGTRPIDPVSHLPVAVSDNPISTLYGGRTYYFETQANLDAFESDPGKYFTGSSAAGGLVESEQNHRQPRRHGC